MDVEELGRVEIDVSDWVEETLRAEPGFADVRSAYADTAAKGHSLRETSRRYFVMQRMGRVEEDVFDPTGKAELGEGVYRRLLSRSPLDELKRTVTDAAGDEVEQVIARYKAYPGAGGQDSIVDGATDAGTLAARRYLREKVPGHVRRMLARLAANGHDPVVEWGVVRDLLDVLAQELGEAMWEEVMA